ncbi:hypothetical protein B0T26DRAFT_749407 [Lasiosphaeria miniovina]|uniref:Uncharacterized protein n=1 Tax=Lasiosphaeria miniovina TaxID=1954250 RepID=A0AA40DZ64_9PEZI|nr:uncharacterized protein B0T26DRAFT_749407 [Lasiosphaeria miniovina]KAK0721939.1 hypothetical protein B0T26DRAFT_749407 [Lasiosphaeria miniovina]
MAITDAEGKLKNAVEMVEDNTKPNINKREEQGLKEVVKFGFGIKHNLGGVHYERHLSTNYTNEGCGTTEFRRQGYAHDYNTAVSWSPEFPGWLQAQLKANKGKAPSELSPADLARVNKIKADNLLGKPGFQIPSSPDTPVRETVANILVSSSLPGSEN